VVDVTYVFYDCEEIESEANGLRRLFGEAPALMSADAAILCEPTGARVEAGCQGTMKVVVSMSGVRAHTARPWTGVNAIHRLGPVIDRLESYSPRRPVIEGFEYREAVQAVGIDGGVAGNVVPDLATLTINHRFAPDHTPEEAEALLREIVGEVDGFEVVDVAAGAPPGFDHPLLAGLVERSGSTPRAKLGWTDVARFAERDVPAANFGPGDPLLAHRPDERVERHDIELVSEALRAVLEKRI
jgi:succinyl-diaminopimelate desuccinylase